MTTLAWVFILMASLIVREVTKGRSITDIPKDLGDAFIALVTNDQAELGKVLARTGDTQSADAPADAVGTGLPGVGGTALLAEAKRLGSAAKGYRWGSVGPDYYDCSGLIWRAMKNLGIYKGIRFTTATFPAVSAGSGFAAKVDTPAVGDIVWWNGHMGIVDGNGTFYSALSKRSGIKTVSIAAIDAQRGAHRFYRITDTGKLLGLNGGTGMHAPTGKGANDPTDYGAQLGYGSTKP